LRVVRWSAAVSLIIYPLFLLAPDWRTQLVMLALLGVCRIGWYAVLQAQLYETLPGQSGAALAVSNLGGLLGGLIPVALGVVAQRAGLTVTMWLLLLGPVALLLGVPRSESREK
jgi:FSR family fosmidomycin resistance protein-like MFS transporter